MEEQVEISDNSFIITKKKDTKTRTKSQTKAHTKTKIKTYSSAFKLKAVRMFLDEHYPNEVLSKELKIGSITLYRWVKLYKQLGESAFISKPKTQHKKSQLHSAVKEQIINLKQSEPTHGIRKISDALRRLFFLKASPESVRKTLHEASLMPSDKSSSTSHKHKRDIRAHKPRFFERSTSNQLWQSDICVFRLGGKYAYLIGFIDDYSRYIVGLDLYMTQTSDNVLEIYRRASSEYRPPKEMLTDNGRQYTSWRGKTKFEQELEKDRINHIRSQPHHPMTLGKIERFWKTILDEFLRRAQFDSFEEARERIKLWTRYYNFKRPHQGIGGLFPADRYFEVASEVRKVVEHGVQENILELALRGKPQKPFYLVGRMDSQTVMLRAEKGKIKLHVDNVDIKNSKEFVYPITEQSNFIGESINGEAEGNTESNPERFTHTGFIKEGEEERPDVIDITAQFNKEMPSCSINMDREENGITDLQGDADKMDDTTSLAEQSLGWNDAGVRTQSELRERSSSEQESAKDAGEERAEDALIQDQCSAPRESIKNIARLKDRTEGINTQERIERIEEIERIRKTGITDFNQRIIKEDKNKEVLYGGIGSSQREGEINIAGAQWANNSAKSIGDVRRISQDVLRVGDKSAFGHDGSLEQQRSGASCLGCRYRKGGDEEAHSHIREGFTDSQADGRGAGGTEAL